MTKRIGKEILVIGDSHASPNHDNRRFDWLGNFIVDKKPDIIVNIGDFASMDSLSTYDKGSIHSEGQRYELDIEAVVDAQQRINKPIDKYNKILTKKKHLKKYKPKKIITLGNHEDRITRAASKDPALWNHLKMSDLQYKEHGWTVYPYLKPYLAQGIAFKHFHTSGQMGKAISGDNHAASLVKKGYHSAVVGHSHLRGYFETINIMEQRMFGLVSGCYFEHNDHYTTESHRNWRGLVMLHEAQNGSCEPAWYSMNYIKSRYS